MLERFEPLEGRTQAGAGGLGFGEPLALFLHDFGRRLVDKRRIRELLLDLADVAGNAIDLAREARAFLVDIDELCQRQHHCRLVVDGRRIASRWAASRAFVDAETPRSAALSFAAGGTFISDRTVRIAVTSRINQSISASDSSNAKLRP
jgi:hypothetical protein